MSNEGQEEYNFYIMGARIAKEERENFERIAEKIEQQYGLDARLEYECGYSITVGKNSLNSLEEDVYKIRKTSRNNIDVEENLRNNSYFGTKGVSNKKDANGHYNEPGVIKGRGK